MNRKQLFIIAIAIILVSLCFLVYHNKAKWNELSSFKICDSRTYSHDVEVNSFTETDISKMKFIETDLSESKIILSKASANFFETGNIWKGKQLALATFTDNSKRWILISNYGGFFFDCTSKKTYKYKNEAREDWDKFISKYSNQLYSLK